MLISDFIFCNLVWFEPLRLAWKPALWKWCCYMIFSIRTWHCRAGEGYIASVFGKHWYLKKANDWRSLNMSYLASFILVTHGIVQGTISIQHFLRAEGCVLNHEVAELFGSWRNILLTMKKLISVGFQKGKLKKPLKHEFPCQRNSFHWVFRANMKKFPARRKFRLR